VASAAEDLFGAARDYAERARRANGDPGGGWGRAADGWPEAVPLLAEAEAALPYPVDALPPVMRAAVTTYQAFGRQPVAMVAAPPSPPPRSPARGWPTWTATATSPAPAPCRSSASA
jgi:predicted amidohydrolase YtcJ